MIDFPNSPTLNQVFTPPGVGPSWKWDGTKWVAQGGAGGYLPLTGGVLSGPGNLALGGAAIPSPVANPSILAGVYQILTAPGSNWMFLLNNIYSDGTNFRAVQTGGSAYLQLTNNSLLFYTAASVAAGAIPSPALAVTANSSGLLLGGTTMPSPVLAGSLFGVNQIVPPINTSTLLIFNAYSDGTNYRYQATNPANLLMQATGGLYLFTAPSGSAGAVATMATKFQVDPNGNVALGGFAIPSPIPLGPFINAYQFLGLTAAAALFTHNLYYDGTNWRLYSANAGSLLQISLGTMYFYNTPSGAAGSVPTLTQRFSIDVSGNVIVGGTLNSAGTISIATHPVIQLDATWTYHLDPSGGNALYLGSAAQNQNYHGNGTHLFASRGLATLFVQFNSAGTYNNSGAWIALSDVRTKTDIEDYTAGLDAICALRPVTYRRNGRAQLPVLERKHLGFVAHEVEAIMPEIVLHEMTRLDPEDEDLTELLATESHNVIYALVNAVRELRDQLAELKVAA